jgi:hypothetical protein
VTTEVPAPNTPSPRAKLRGIVGLATLAVSSVAAPMAFGASGSTSSVTQSTTSTPVTGTPQAPTVNRFAGADRIDTAIAVADAGYGVGKTKAAVAVLSRDDNFADALAGNALAAQKKGPLLLTPTAGLDARVAAALRNDVAAGGTVYVLGGVNALSAKVEGDVKALGFTVTRLAGANRFDTAVQIAGQVSAHPHTVLVATGLNSPDALAAGAAAATDPNGGVVLLSSDGVLPPETSKYLGGVDPTKTAVYGVGGQGSDALKTLPAFVGHVTEFRGTDRYDSATKIASNTTLFPAPNVVGLAKGTFWADALSGGAYLGTQHAPLLLTDPAQTGMPGVERTWLKAHAGRIGTVDVFGGTAAVSDAVKLDALGAATANGPIAGTTAPTAVLVAKSKSGLPGIPVTFDALKSTPGSTAIASYTFDFGDGSAPVTTTAPTTVTTHTYAQVGLYKVTLTVTDIDGGAAIAAINAYSIGTITPPKPGGSNVGTTGLQIQVGIMDDHHHAGSVSKPSPWCSGAELIGPANPFGTLPVLFYGGSDGNSGCGSGWDTPGIWIKNPTGATTTVDLKVTVGSHSWSLWSPVTLQPNQSVIFAQTGSNNFDPADTYAAGTIGSDPILCLTPSSDIPVINVIVNGKTVPVKDPAKVINTGGVDAAGCISPSPGSATRSNESLPWQNP